MGNNFFLAIQDIGICHEHPIDNSRGVDCDIPTCGNNTELHKNSSQFIAEQFFRSFSFTIFFISCEARSWSNIFK